MFLSVNTYDDNVLPFKQNYQHEIAKRFDCVLNKINKTHKYNIFSQQIWINLIYYLFTQKFIKNNYSSNNNNK